MAPWDEGGPCLGLGEGGVTGQRVLLYLKVWDLLGFVQALWALQHGICHLRGEMCPLEQAGAVSWQLSIQTGLGHLKIDSLGNAGGF